MRRSSSFSDVDRTIDEVRAAIPTASILNGHQLDDIDLGTTTIKVAHRLGRPFNGYIVVKRSAAEEVYDASAGKRDQATNLHLTASGAVTVSLWVF